MSKLSTNLISFFPIQQYKQISTSGFFNFLDPPLGPISDTCNDERRVGEARFAPSVIFRLYNFSYTSNSMRLRFRCGLRKLSWLIFPFLKQMRCTETASKSWLPRVNAATASTPPIVAPCPLSGAGEPSKLLQVGSWAYRDTLQWCYIGKILD